jgi:hypothetical protein
MRDTPDRGVTKEKRAHSRDTPDRVCSSVNARLNA